MAAQPDRVRKLAEGAITMRLGYYYPAAIISVERDGDAVLLHVNSGGNARECEIAFQLAGYTVARTDYDPFAPGNYGVRLRITKGSS